MSVNKTIFPGFVDVPQLEDTAIHYSNSAGLLNLSRVSKTAQKKLNNSFFLERLWQEYPCLAENKDKLFVVLFKNHPTLCGKILCRAFFQGSLQMSFSFFMEETPKICQLKQSEKQLCQSQYKEICGSYYKDPKSPIHQASEKRKAAKQQLEQCDAPYEAAEKRLQAAHSREESCTISRMFSEQPNHYFPNQEIAGWLKAGTDEEIAPLKKEHLSDYYLVFRKNLMWEAVSKEQSSEASIEFQRQQAPDTFELVVEMENDPEYKMWNQCLVESGSCQQNYYALEQQRILCENKIKEIDKDLAVLNPSHLKELKMISSHFCSSGIFSRLTRLEKRKSICENDLKFGKMMLNGLLETGPEEYGGQVEYDRRISFTSNGIESRRGAIAEINQDIDSTFSSILGKKDEPVKRNYLLFFARCQTALEKEFKKEANRVKLSIQTPILKECLSLLKEAIETKEAGKKPSSVLVDKIRSRINSLDREYKKVIWGTLYVNCAGAEALNIPRWSEYSFPGFLTDLEDIVTKALNGQLVIGQLMI
jgi:hypothetical protein